MTTHFIVHDKADMVGVMVVEDVPAGENLTGWIMETDETIALKALDPVPLGPQNRPEGHSVGRNYP